MPVMLDGKSLTLRQLAAVARECEKAELTAEACAAVDRARAYVERKLDEGAVVYGLTTGFGKFSDVRISREETAHLQRNLILSHACGLGDPLPTENVRAAMKGTPERSTTTACTESSRKASSNWRLSSPVISRVISPAYRSSNRPLPHESVSFSTANDLCPYE